MPHHSPIVFITSSSGVVLCRPQNHEKGNTNLYYDPIKGALEYITKFKLSWLIEILNHMASVKLKIKFSR